jgi:hypothetical protein
VAWITEADMRRVVASVLKLGTPASLPAHWDEPVQAAIESAYTYLRAVLAGRNVTPAQMDQWDMRRVFTRRIALCDLFEEVGLPDQANLATLDRACQAKEEVKTIDLTVNGVPIEPAGTSPNCGYGDTVDDDDATRGGPLGRITSDTVL